MKNIFFTTLLLSSFQVALGQTDDYPMPDSSEVVSFPWYDDDQYLVDYITQRGFYENNWGAGGSNLRTVCNSARYQIPVKMHIYRDNGGTLSSNITEANAKEVLAVANDLFINTGIQFYIADPTRFDNDENWRTGIESFAETITFFTTEGFNGYLNIHFIHSSSEFGRGYAVTPFYPSSPGSRWNCTVETQNFDPIREGNVLAHELGHTLGLLHTHHPGRVASLAFNEENATIGNGCYQEMRERSRTNQFAAGCFNTDGKKKCAINGDFLCDTAGDPGQSTETNASGTKTVTTDCVYLHGGYGNDYLEDNKGDDWTPPTTNIMSYSNRTCRNEFSPQQVGQMWYYIDSEFPFEHEAIVSNSSVPSCTGGTTYQLQNVPSGINGGLLAWNVQPTGLVDVSTVSGTGTSAFIKAKNSSVSGAATIEWRLSTTDCNAFSTSKDIWIGKPKLQNPSISGNASVTCNSTYIYDYDGVYLGTASGSDIRWEIGPQFDDVSSGTSTTLFIDPVDTGQGYVTFVAYNNCGEAYTCKVVTSVNPGCASSAITFPNPYSCGTRGGGRMMSSSSYPNPTSYAFHIEIEGLEKSLAYVNEQSVDVSIYSYTNERVYHSSMTKDQKIISVVGLKNGTYMLHISYKGEILHTQRVVKNSL